MMTPVITAKFASRAVASLVIAWMVWAGFHYGSSFGADPSRYTDEVVPQVPKDPFAPENIVFPKLAPAPARPESRRDDTLITFTYSETPNSRANLEFFVRQALHWNADFIFILNGETDAPELIPEMENVRVVKRNNTCYDMGALGEVLRTDDLWKKYKRFISVNSSVRGPFLPHWNDACWSDLYLDRVTDEVKLVGMTANCWPRGHIQSMIFATDSTGMGVLLDPSRAIIGVADPYGTEEDPVGLSACYDGHNPAVHSEIGLATLIQQAGYEVDAMMTAFHMAKNLQDYCQAIPKGQEDPLYDNHYFGFNVHPYETIFAKTNRGIDPAPVGKLTEWALAEGRSSFDTCKS